MKKIVFFTFFLFLFACDTSSVNSAYKDYYRYQQQYISAILDDNKNSQVKALKNLIKCAKFLNFDTSEYRKKLNKLTAKKSETQVSTPKNIKKTRSKYISIISFNPLKIKTSTKKVKFFTLKSKGYIKKVLDINGIVSKPVFKKLKNVNLKIAQYNKNTVRIVYYSKKDFFIKYSLKNGVLTVKLTDASHKPTLTTTLTQKPKAYKPGSKIIVIDPGHGGKDAGGVGIGRKMEKIAVLKIAKYLKQYLTDKGYTVYLTRNGDYFIPLKKRTHFANLKKADLFISIHCNIAPKHKSSIKGIETYFLSPSRNERAIRVARLENREIKGLNYLDQRVILNFLNRDRMIDSNKLAIDIQQGMLNSLRKHYRGIRDGGVRPAPFWVLVGTQMPAILIETGYLTNPTEAKRLFTPSYQKQLAKGIAQGIENYFRKNP